MIIVGLMGGVGNQLFQYATARRLSIKLGVDLFIDPFLLKHHFKFHTTARPFLLDRFNVECNLINQQQLNEFLFRNHPIKKNICNILGKHINCNKLIKSSFLFVEQDQNFDSRVLHLDDNIYMRGYFQNERYFIDIRNILINEIKIKKPTNQENRYVLEDIKKGPSVCVHVRRGDYYSNPFVRKTHAVDLSQYYQSSIRMMEEKVINCRFFIFSDDRY